MSSNNTCSVLILLFSLLFFLVLDSLAHTSLSSCPSTCGEIKIPYPFGMGKGCYLDNGYEIECKNVTGMEVPFLSISSKEVVNISLPSLYGNGSMSNGSLVIKSPITTSSNDGSLLNLTGKGNSQWLHAKQYATVELEWSFRTANFTSLDCENRPECTCENRNDSGIIYANCRCTYGYRGNPYLLGGCEDFDECQEFDSFGRPVYCYGGSCVNFQGSYECRYKYSPPLAPGWFLIIGIGVLIFIGVGVCVCICIRKRRRNNRKKKFFKRNGGLLLQQQLTSTQGSVETTRVFTSKELAKATGNFCEKRVLGQGGQGTVYKGMLIDGRIVAVKKSKVVDEDKLEEFVNEVVILSQTNHRNIVKLLGCCLEAEVPLLVYEFVSNGNLFEHLHDDESPDQTMATTWEMRLRIAIEIAGALSYLHSSASAPIYHRDIKSTNIMLDEKYRAKVSDFGTSRSVTEDHTHLTTAVSGTAGYLDPEYFQSSQFTDKSDVYSFGVVLVELITGEKPISFLRSQENRTLATYFSLAAKENRVVDIIDARIRDGCKVEQVMAVAKVARRCLNLKRKKRPSMRQVCMELEMICSSPEDMQPHEYVSENEEEVVEVMNIEVESMNNVAFTAPVSQYNVVGSSSSWSDVEPLFPLQTL